MEKLIQAVDALGGLNLLSCKTHLTVDEVGSREEVMLTTEYAIPPDVEETLLGLGLRRINNWSWAWLVPTPGNSQP
jgi:hypothetical protein